MTEQDPQPQEGSAAGVEVLLRSIASGDVRAERELYTVLYTELRRLAGAVIAGDRHVSIQPTELVHEAYLKLIGAAGRDYDGRTHFLAVAAKAMRQILVDAARRRHAKKRGGEWHRITLSGISGLGNTPDAEILDLHRALERLSSEDERMARVVELRVFSGLTVKEVAAVLGVSARTVDVDWKAARLWLAKQMRA